MIDLFRRRAATRRAEAAFDTALRAEYVRILVAEDRRRLTTR